MKKILALALSLLLLLSFAACSKSDTLTEPSSADPSGSSDPAPAVTRMDKIKEAGVLVVGTSADYPPFEFHTMIDGVDTITGYDMMIAKAIADSLGVELQIEDMAFDGLLISLSEDMFDLVLAGMSENPDRLQAADFSVSTIEMDWAVIIRAEDDGKFNATTDFAESTIGIQSGTVYKSAAIEMVGEENVVELVNMADLIMDLQNGNIDAIVANDMTTAAYASGNADLLSKDVGIISDEPGQAACVMKGQPEWLAYVNDQITQMQQNGQLTQFLADAEALASTASTAAE